MEKSAIISDKLKGQLLDLILMRQDLEFADNRKIRGVCYAAKLYSGTSFITMTRDGINTCIQEIFPIVYPNAYVVSYTLLFNDFDIYNAYDINVLKNFILESDVENVYIKMNSIQDSSSPEELILNCTDFNIENLDMIFNKHIISMTIEIQS